MPWNMAQGRKEPAAMTEPDLSNLKRDAKGNILRSELLRINKPVLRQLPLQKRRTVVRWLRGRKYWNAWAEKMLARRKELEEKGEWSAEEGIDPSKGFLFVEKGGNQSTKEWLSEAEANFSNLDFYIYDQNDAREVNTDKNSNNAIIIYDIEFKNLIFPSLAKFINTSFYGATGFLSTKFFGAVVFENANFSNAVVFQRANFFADVNFGDVIFSGIAVFDNATFSGGATFGHAIFSDDAYFTGATFFSAVSFDRTTFSSNVYFTDTTFSSAVSFGRTTFSGAVAFGRATFSSDVYFEDATFSGEANFWGAKFAADASFRLATFKEGVVFSGACFRKDADFSAIRSQRSFNMQDTHLRIAPDFSEAAFHAPPALDEVRIEEQLRKRSGALSFRSLPGVTRQKALDVSRRFRALGKMAHEARDWLNEMEFFAQEIRTRRFGLDKPFGEGMGRFWFGWIYEALSNFGRSFARPLGWWAGLVAAFAGLYARMATGGDWSWLDPVYLSVRHGLVVGGLVRTGHMQDVIAHMFGKLDSGLALLMMLQTVLSAFFLFLFFLAVRNHFRIR